MKAAVSSGIRRIRVLDVETPKTASNEVLIKTKAIGICGTDLHFYSGSHGRIKNLLERIEAIVYPSKTIMGHEFSGFIIDKGKNVNDVELNDKVTAWPVMPCHECKYCKMGLMHLCENIRPCPGAFCEFVKVPSENVVKIPEQLSYEEAAMLEPLASAVHAVKLAKIEKEPSVTILGAGTIGLLILQVAKAFGVKKILVMDILEFKLEVAKKLGADTIMNTLKINFHDEKNLTKEVDTIFECVGGTAPTLNQAINLINKRGKIVAVGSFTSPPQINMLKFRRKELTMISSEASEKRDFLKGINLLINGKVKVNPLITHKFPLGSISEAFETALRSEQTKSIKVEIIP
jgi:2-desacetyl-2-hydroxyethyl bacteriochlorophyllide A dehydrogenase